MPIQTLWYNGKHYPQFTASGYAARFAFAFAKEVCQGYGYDIGAGKPEWALPGARVIDPAIDRQYDAMHLPDTDFGVDYIFSSHCLEHLPDWVGALNYWQTKLKPGGVLFLYLPSYAQEYWRPWNNRKHLHAFTPELLDGYFNGVRGWTNVYVTGVDLNFSFTVIAERV